ncbi:TPA: hypothetical protein RQO57_004463 [Aeromonas dhakensis]|uniref:hypothetical protein n=1 Tax=Aeromonas dhakensis TaxID=196024 RepID=UPI002890FFCB|nr:hypothetical protein [Aeromonas dhakensis]
MTQKRTLLELAEEANSLYETAVTRWVEQQPELAAQAKKIMDEVLDSFEPEVAEVLTNMKLLPWGGFIAWYEQNLSIEAAPSPSTHWYVLTRGADMGLIYNEEKRTWHRNIYKATAYHSILSAKNALLSIENSSATIAKIISDGIDLKMTRNLDCNSDGMDVHEV